MYNRLSCLLGFSFPVTGHTGGMRVSDPHPKGNHVPAGCGSLTRDAQKWQTHHHHHHVTPSGVWTLGGRAQPQQWPSRWPPSRREPIEPSRAGRADCRAEQLSWRPFRRVREFILSSHDSVVEFGALYFPRSTTTTTDDSAPEGKHTRGEAQQRRSAPEGKHNRGEVQQR